MRFLVKLGQVAQGIPVIRGELTHSFETRNGGGQIVFGQ